MSFYQKHVQKDGSWLSLMEKPAETSYECGGCKESDVQPCYKGNVNGNPQYHLHKECYDSYSASNSSLKFPFLKNKGCDFKFQQQVPHGGSCCDACGKRVKGWSYECKICRHPHYLHSYCAKLPITQKVGRNVLELAAESPRECLICGTKGLRSWYYVSNGRPKYCFHWSCMKDMSADKWKEYSEKTSSGIGTSSRASRNQYHGMKPANLISECMEEVAVEILAEFFSLVLGLPVPLGLLIGGLKWFFR